MSKVIIEDGEPVLRSDWYVEDIIGQDDTLTEEQAIAVMELIARTHDANVGINWEVIDSAIDIIKEEANENI